MKAHFFLSLFILLLIQHQAVTAAGSADSLFAAQLNLKNIDRLPQGGMDAIGGLHDWLLSDGELCAVIADAGHTTYLAAGGGTLIDLWHCDDANDEWSVLQTQLNLQREAIPPVEQIVATVQDGKAWVQTMAAQQGVEVRTRYLMDRARPGVLTIETQLERSTEGARLGMVGAMILHPGASLIPFGLDFREPKSSPGFALKAVNTSDSASVLASVNNVDTQILMGTRHASPGITYGVRLVSAQHFDANGNKSPLTTFLIGGRTFSMFGLFTRPFPAFWSRKPGAVSFALGQVTDLKAGEVIKLTQRILVNRGASVAGITDRLYTGPTVHGRITSRVTSRVDGQADARSDTREGSVTVRNLDGEPVTFTRVHQDGNFSFRLPAFVSRYTLDIETAAGQSKRSGDVDKALDLGALATAAPARLQLPSGVPMNLAFLSEQGNVRVNSEYVPHTVDGSRRALDSESYRFSLSGTTRDPAELELPAGRYRIIASRGPEYTAHETSMQLFEGETHTLAIEQPQPAVDTRGLIGADFHVHSGISFDSSLTPRQRVIEFLAHGGEVLVPTEHNVTFDINPVIEELALQEQLLSFPGVELTGMARSAATPTTIAHSNVFPVADDSTAFAGGTSQIEGMRLGQVISDYKSRFPGSIFQLNHPRSLHPEDEDLSFFNHLSVGKAFDPEGSLDSETNGSLVEPLSDSEFRDIDFDAIELLNGHDMALYELVRRDWFALLRNGVYKVALANSDSHRSDHIVGYPRSFVAVENDDITSVEIEDILAGVRRGAVYGTTGPVLRVTLDGKGPGEVVHGRGGELKISVDAAPWISVTEAHVWINGTLAHTVPVVAGEKSVVTIDQIEDSYVFVEVLGEPAATYSGLLPGFVPFAFANPVFIDTNGDGWEPGGSNAPSE